MSQHENRTRESGDGNVAFFVSENRGKIIGARGADASLFLTNAGGVPAIRAGTENVFPQKTIFENLAALPAAAGMPWETARERISREMKFWFGDDSPATAARVPAGRAELKTLALACALAAKNENAALLLPAELISDSESVRRKLRERARGENFAVIAETDDLHQAIRIGAETLAVFYADENGTPKMQTGTPAEIFSAPESLAVAKIIRGDRGNGLFNLFSGTVLEAGAGQFFARLDGEEEHCVCGRLCGNVPDDIPAGTRIEIFLPPEIFHLDAFPPEENFFELESGGEIFFDGSLYFRRFAAKGKTRALRVASQFRQSLEIPEGGSLFAWFFPEDALGEIGSKKNQE